MEKSVKTLIFSIIVPAIVLISIFFIFWIITNNLIPEKTINYKTIESTSNKIVDNMIEIYKNKGISVSNEDVIRKESIETLIEMLESKGYTIEKRKE